jgi:hypothetical protein
MATGETADPRDRELEALRRENAEIPELKRRIAELERLLTDALRKLEEAQRAQKRQAAPRKLSTIMRHSRHEFTVVPPPPERCRWVG